MNTFGNIFKVTIFGESHGPQVGVVIDGCPPGIPIHERDFQYDIARRKSGSKGTTKRIETDIPVISSGVFKGKTTGAPVMICFNNDDINSNSYESVAEVPRPGHADFTALIKYGGFNDYRGGGHFSGRLTVGLVSAGVIAKKIIDPITISSELTEAGGSKNIDQALNKAIKDKDSIGGIIECTCRNVPVGTGEPFFDSVESYISHLAFSIPGIKGIEFGAGFSAVKMKGSQYNDKMIDISGQTSTNNTGGISGGISNGNDIVFRVAVRPTASISKVQTAFNIKEEKPEKISVEGRHDTCIALRMPVIVEAASAIALCDLMLISGLLKK